MKKIIILGLFFISIIYGQIYPSYEETRSTFQVTYTTVPAKMQATSVLAGIYDEDEGNAVRLKTYLFLEYTDLVFERDEENWSSEYAIAIGLYDGRRQVAGSTKNNHISLENYSQTSHSMEYTTDSISVTAPPGTYSLHIVVTDKNSGRERVKHIEEIVLPNYNDKWAVSMPVFFDEGIIKSPAIKLMDSTYFNLSVLAPRDSFFILSYEVINFRKSEFKAYDTVRISDAISIDSLSESDDASLLMNLQRKVYLPSIHGGQKTFRVSLRDMKNKEKAQSELPVRILANYADMTEDDFDKELYLLGIIAKNNEIKKLEKATPEERDSLVKEFWKNNDPTPNTDKNEYKDEFLRRINYANDHFSIHRPGYRTDRGRIYIEYGPPDEIEDHPFEAGTYPYVMWYYFSHNATFTFVDRIGNGDYVLWSID